MIRFVPEARSTNGELAGQLAGNGHVPEGDWLVAYRQTAGRGRSGREWCDGAGNFMGSTVVRPRFGDPAAPTLALVAGLAVHAVVSGYIAPTGPAHRGPPTPPSVLSLSKHRLSSRLGAARKEQGGPSTSSGQSGVGGSGMPMPTLKWPNDLLVDGAKLAGILLESERDAVVVGIGVNLAQAPTVTGRETTSLAQLGIRADRDRFAHDLAQQFELDLQRWRDFGLAPIIRRWLAAAHPLGTPLCADSAEGRIEGTFAGLADDGALRLQLGGGAIRIIHAGEVRLLDEVGG